MKVGVIGAGNIGADLAKKLSAAGHGVRLANSRGPETIADLAAKIGVTAVPVPDAVKDAEIIILSIPQKNIPDLPKDLFASVPQDAIIIDTGNYYPGLRDDPIEQIEAGLPESIWVQRQIGRPVIKVFNSILANSLATGAKPKGAPGRIALPVAGDDSRAKAIVMELVDSIGFDAIDAGSLEESWRQQPGNPSYCKDLSAQDLPAALAAANREDAPRLRDEALRKAGLLPS